jgi:hypothetical protein
VAAAHNLANRHMSAIAQLAAIPIIMAACQTACGGGTRKRRAVVRGEAVGVNAGDDRAHAEVGGVRPAR